MSNGGNQSGHTESSSWSKPSKDLLTQIRNELSDLPILPDPKSAVDAMVEFGRTVQETKGRISKGETGRTMDLSGARSASEKVESIHPSVLKMMGLVIRQMLRESGEGMDPDEREYWEGLSDALENPAEWYNSLIRSERASLDVDRPHDYSGTVCWCGARGIHGGQSR